MSSRRLVLISRRYWPLVGGAERAMAGLARQFVEMGHSVRVLTARWESHWPAEIVHREVPVSRLSNPRTRGWGTYRYMVHLKSWLNKNRQDIDAVLVSMLKHDAYAAIRSLRRTSIPVIVRAEGAGSTGDCDWHRTARFGGRIKRMCLEADAWIAPGEAVEKELVAAEFPQERIHQVPNGVEVPETGAYRQQLSRDSLADAHPILKLDPGEPLVVYTGRLDLQKGLLDLVAAWPKVSHDFPNARLWLVGEGADGPEIWNQIRQTHQAHQIIMPGSFDEVQDVLAAADVFVLPSYQEGMSLSLLEAMAMEVPVVASNIPSNSDLLGEDRGYTFQVRNPESLAETILLAIRKREARRRAENARQYVRDHFSLSNMADQHLQVIHSAIDRRATGTGLLGQVRK